MVRSVVSWACWFAALTGLWLLYVGAFDRVDLVAGMLAAAVAATAAEVVRRHGLLGFRLEQSWVAPAWKVPFQILWEFGIVAWALAQTLVHRRKPFQSGFKTIPFPAGGDDPVSAGRRAWAAWAFTVSPNDYVIDIDCDEDRALVRGLVLERVKDELL